MKIMNATIKELKKVDQQILNLNYLKNKYCVLFIKFQKCNCSLNNYTHIIYSLIHPRFLKIIL